MAWRAYKPEDCPPSSLTYQIYIVFEIDSCNIFEEEDRRQNHVGIGTMGTPVLAPGVESKFTFDFVLGAAEENPE
ncbi:hypothetical protein, partial [Desulfosporosinus sp.]|uniref:hypothetical protein n=1 Tax=Desulfosporosinus sp. TaxID=157907 RepID=UPI00260628C3